MLKYNNKAIRQETKEQTNDKKDRQRPTVGQTDALTASQTDIQTNRYHMGVLMPLLVMRCMVAVLQRNHCNTNAPIWLDLQGQTLPSTPGTEITVRGCGSWTSGCCQYLTQPVTVRQCGGYFVYRHLGVGTCNYAYCVQADH